MSREAALSPNGCVILVIDVQRYCTDPERGCHKNQKRSDLPYYFDRLETVLHSIAALLATARFTKAEVIYTVIECLTADGRDRGLDYKLSGLLVPKGHPDAAIHPAIAPQPDEIILRKTTCSPFESTSLDYVLRSIGTQRLVICGLVTNQCVESAVRAAADKGYAVVVAEDCCGAYSREEHDAAVRNMRGFARIATSKQLVAELKSTASIAPLIPPYSKNSTLLFSGGDEQPINDTESPANASSSAKKRQRSAIGSEKRPALSMVHSLSRNDMEKAGVPGEFAGAGIISSGNSDGGGGAVRTLKIALLRTDYEGIYGPAIPKAFQDLLDAVALAVRNRSASNSNLNTYTEAASATTSALDEWAESVPPVRFEITEFDVTKQEYPEARETFDGYVIPGAACSAYDELGWVKRLCEEIRLLDAEEKPLLGVCFGHQIVAQALGGEVRRSPNKSLHYSRQWFQLLPHDTPAGGAGLLSPTNTFSDQQQRMARSPSSSDNLTLSSQQSFSRKGRIASSSSFPNMATAAAAAAAAGTPAAAAALAPPIAASEISSFSSGGLSGLFGATWPSSASAAAPAVIPNSGVSPAVLIAQASNATGGGSGGGGGGGGLAAPLAATWSGNGAPVAGQNSFSGSEKGCGVRLALLYHHNDVVTRVPERAANLGQSSMVGCHGMKLGRHIVTFQAHPEFATGVTGAACMQALLQKDANDGIISREHHRRLSAEAQQPVATAWCLALIADVLVPHDRT